MKNLISILAAFALIAMPAAAQQYPSPTYNNLNLKGVTAPGGLIVQPDGDVKSTPVFDVMAYDFVDSVSGDNSPAFAILKAAIDAGGKGGRIKFPCGTFRFTSKMDATIPSNSNITIEGEGCTRLIFPTTDGIELTYTNNSSWSVIRDIEVATGAASAGTRGIRLLSAVVNEPQNARQSLIENVHLNGSDALGGTNYWGTAIFQDKVSFLNVYNVTCNGSGTLQGDCIRAEGDAGAAKFNVVTRVTHSNFAYCNSAFHYGTYYQGLSFIGNDATGCNRAVYSPAGNALNLQATIVGNQLSNGIASVDFQSEIGGLTVADNEILLNGSGYGVRTVGVTASSITGNSCKPAFTAGTGNCFSIGTSANAAELVNIANNQCQSSATCISIASGAKGQAIGNGWWNVTSPYQNLSSTFFQRDNIQNGAQFVSQAGPLSGVTYNDIVTVNNLLGSKTSPTISSGFCTSPGVLVPNGTWSFRILVGSACAANNGVITMPASSNGWDCKFTSGTASGSSVPVMDLTASTATTVTIRNYSRTTGALANFTSNDVILASCTGQ